MQMLEDAIYDNAVHQAFIADTKKLDIIRKTDITAIDSIFERILRP